MKYKVGDRVRIRSLQWYNSLKDVAGTIDCGVEDFTEEMSEFCGKEFLVSGIYADKFRDVKCYELAGTEHWLWTDTMLEDAVVLEIKTASTIFTVPLESKEEGVKAIQELRKQLGDNKITFMSDTTWLIPWHSIEYVKVRTT